MGITTSDYAFVVATVVNLIVAVITLVVFCILRPRFPTFYYPKALGRNQINSGSYFKWISHLVFHSSLKRILKRHGLDAYMYLRFLQTILFIFVAYFLFFAITLFPIHFTGEYSFDDGNKTVSFIGLESLTLSNIPPKSPRLWAHFLFTILLSATVYVVLYVLMKEYTELRAVHLEKRLPENHTVLITGVAIHNEAEATSYVQRILPFHSTTRRNSINEVEEGLVRSVHVVFDTEELVELQQKYERNIFKLERAIVEQESQPERLMHKSRSVKRPLGDPNTEKDRIEYYQDKLQGIYRDIISRQEHDVGLKPVNAAFITFQHKNVARLLTQSVLTDRLLLGEQVHQAPDPKAVVWKNISASPNGVFVRKLVLDAFVLAMSLLWVIPIGFFSLLTTVENLDKMMPSLVNLLRKSQLLFSIVEGILPVLLTIIFLAMVPFVIRTATSKVGYHSQIKIELVVTQKLFVFYYINVFMSFLLGPSALDLIKRLSTNSDFNTIVTLLSTNIPLQSEPMMIYVMTQALSSFPGELLRIIVTLLSTNIPLQSEPMMIYVMTQALSSFPGELLRIVPLIIRAIYHRFLCKTVREHEKADKDTIGYFDYVGHYSQDLLIFAIVITYSTMQPMILLFAIVYYCLALFTTLYNIQFVFPREYNAGGVYWTATFGRMLFGLGVFQLTMVGLLGAKQFYASPVLLVLIPITIVFYRYCDRLFSKRAKYGPLQSNRGATIEIDEIREGSVLIDEEDLRDNMKDSYQQNELFPPEQPMNRMEENL
ncbi:hypothetical protein PROFUN_13784 [Planoprotostelium fungivorum]|uniref:DUF221-domain-containing protein n=1 Tax=Planoprotostelium fungivorum TaxID=1890364 RepID=A0A2P6N374_9EUKA|nr:hypothetical protein PROFUN_13784 [Planoprotostelium fungivorum]